MKQPHAVRRDAAVVCCNKAHLPYASLTLFLLDYYSPGRNFDLVLCASDNFELPPVLQRIGVRLLQINASGIQRLRTTRLPSDAYLRLLLPNELSGEYRRILYLDTDIFIQGGDIESLMNANLGTHPLGAVLERPMWGHPKHHAKDFKASQLEKSPYFNSGVLLIDTDQYNSQGVLEACVDVNKRFSGLLHYHDQSLLNIALYRNWAQLSPVWNWQWATRKPILEPIASPYFIHFYGPQKPWLKQQKEVPLRYRYAYSTFLSREFPDVQMEDSASLIDVTRGESRLKLLPQAFSWLRFRRYFESFSEDNSTITEHFSI